MLSANSKKNTGKNTLLIHFIYYIAKFMML